MVKRDHAVQSVHSTVGIFQAYEGANAVLAPSPFSNLLDTIHRQPWEWDQSVLISQQTMSGAAWLLENMHSFNGCMAWRPQQVVRIECNASNLGWGATSIETGALARAYWGKPLVINISDRETLTVLMAAQSFMDQLRGRVCKFFVDNMAARKTV